MSGKERKPRRWGPTGSPGEIEAAGSDHRRDRDDLAPLERGRDLGSDQKCPGYRSPASRPTEGRPAGERSRCRSGGYPAISRDRISRCSSGRTSGEGRARSPVELPGRDAGMSIVAFQLEHALLDHLVGLSGQLPAGHLEVRGEGPRGNLLEDPQRSGRALMIADQDVRELEPDL